MKSEFSAPPFWSAGLRPDRHELCCRASASGNCSGLAWKEAVLAQIAARRDAAPAPLPPQGEWARLDPDQYDYRRVILRGTFDHAKESPLFRASATGAAGDGPGYEILTPLAPRRWRDRHRQSRLRARRVEGPGQARRRPGRGRSDDHRPDAAAGNAQRLHPRRRAGSKTCGSRATPPRWRRIGACTTSRPFPSTPTRRPIPAAGRKAARR